MLTGNKGEWSEIYVLLKLLADGKIHAADGDLNRLEDVYFPILNIIREELKDQVVEYKTGEIIELYFNGKKYIELPKDEFNTESILLFNELKNKKSKGTFSVERTESFMNKILCYKLSAPASDKSDIRMKILDINTGYSPTVGFSIKSEVGSAPTLLNAGKTTNFIYKITHNFSNMVTEANDIYKVSGTRKHTDVRGRIAKIIEEEGIIEYYQMENKIFHDNLVLVDSNMDKIVSETLLYFFRDGISNCEDMIKKLELENPMKYGNVNAYRYKMKKFLTAIALGMKPATVWDGIDDATGGYIIVTREGEVLAYHIYNRNYFEEYLVKNTKFETASTSRHDFGSLYEEDGATYIKLNLQIRFK